MNKLTSPKFILSFLLFSISFILLSCQKTTFKDALPGSADGQTGLIGLPVLNNKPNIILIVGDDIGYEIPTINGGQSYSTPTLDRLTANGLQFTQCHASPLCSPSRTALLTGKYNFRNYSTWGSLPQTEKTFANMMLDAGYKTCVAGKWQFDGGVQAINNFGFQSYCVWDAFKSTHSNEEGDDGDIGSMYKNPKIYQNGAFLPDSAVNGKYGQDFFNQYAKNFIDSNTNHPFFLYFPTVLCHAPFSPTPDDAAFAAWNPNVNKSDTTYFPSMVKYMDKSINGIVNEVAAKGLANKTLILFIGDNGTPSEIYSLYKNAVVQGGKGHTTEWGTHVPLIAYCPSKIRKGIVKDLVCLPDFLPTLADVANIPKPTTYGTLDGVSFYNQLSGTNATPRSWIYNYYNPHPDEQPTNTSVWVQDTTYKLYNVKQTGFYNIYKDVYEKMPIPNNKLTLPERQTKIAFQAIIDSIGSTK